MFALRLFLFRQVRKIDQPLSAPVTRPLPKIFEFLGRVPPLRRGANRLLINAYAYATSPRPRPLSMESDYTSWRSLTDRSFTGRHLPPATTRPVDWPSREAVVDLYRRPENHEIKATDTSALFTFFAQWFTDAFLRTSQSNFRRNASTHAIDLCQIYGLSAGKTEILRSHDSGRLKSQLLGRDGKPDPNGEEYPPYLYEDGPDGKPMIKHEFKDLHKPQSLEPFIQIHPENMKYMFAVGLEYGNSTIGHTMLNTVFLREHNRIVGLLEAEYPDWDKDRLFETTRNIVIVLLLKLIVEEYVRHIAPFDFPFEFIPFIADDERWDRPNWMSIEFDLLYRWHSLVPDAIGEITADECVNNNPLVFSCGIDSLVAQLSRERAGKIGLLNTPEFLIERVERPTVDLMREARLRSFNDYRAAFGLKRLTSFEQLTKNADVRRRLEPLYGDIDNLEWYVGIFAEDYPEYRMMGSLMTTMVANDAFTQALTNPLLARNIFNEETFSKVGMGIIEETQSLQQIIARNSKSPGAVYASFRCAPTDRG